MVQKTCVIFCRCGAGIINEEALNKLSKGLQQFEVSVFELRDLCAFTINEKDVLKTIAAEFQQKIIIACYPRAIKNMFRQADIDFGNFTVLNFRELTPDTIFSKLKTDFQIPAGKASYQVQITALDVPAWFPVIDESRCTLCGRCARFCLFGVYTFDKKSLTVIHPLACKNNCPACGRTCPTSAIIFPRLAENSTLSGAESTENKITVDQGSLLMTLNERNLNRRNIFRQGVVEQAEAERRKALEEFKTGQFKLNRND
jgi:heterodisulfide reductase subunit A-like polyferredoxin